MSYYRATSDGLGIFEAVEADCPKGHELRHREPDSSWLPRPGKKLKNSISYWTEEGMMKYVESGLKDWHELVTTMPLEVQMLEEIPGKVIYKDKYQILIEKDSVN